MYILGCLRYAKQCVQGSFPGEAGACPGVGGGIALHSALATLLCVCGGGVLVKRVGTVGIGRPPHNHAVPPTVTLPWKLSWEVRKTLLLWKSRGEEVF